MVRGLRTPLTVDDVDRMTDRLYIRYGPQRGRKWSAFWVLLVLAAVIATVGIISDSTATVIGAMIVAPLMTPILGTALAIVLADRRQVLQNAGLVLAGAAVVVAIGYLLGALDFTPVLADTNSQVAGRVSPALPDLVGALATGAVGAFALVRSDVSDTLPGVAIAISLVPPLAVVGLTLESGAPTQAAGALLLFATNVAAIIAMGTAVLLGYKLRHVAKEGGRAVGQLKGRTLAAVGGLVVLVAIPLAVGSIEVWLQSVVISRASPVAKDWAAKSNWVVSDVTYGQGKLHIVAVGPPPQAKADELRTALDDAGLTSVDADVTLIIGGTKDLPSTKATATP